MRPDNIKTTAGTTPQQPTAPTEERFLYFMFPGSLITAVDLIVALAIRVYTYIIFGFHAIVRLIIKHSASAAEETYRAL